MQPLKRNAKRSNALHRLKWITLCASIAATAGLNGCAKDERPEGTAAQLCRSWKEIGIRKADKLSTDTAREIVGNNEVRPEWCGKEDKRIAEARK